MKTVVLNSKNEPIILDEVEGRLANYLHENIKNSLGFDIDITTLTSISKKVSEQKFFEIQPSDYLPVIVGEGAWSSDQLTYRSFQLGDDFATGVVNTAGNNSRLAQVDAGVDSVSQKIRNWAKGLTWTLMELNQASKAGNWDIVATKEKSRKRNWDLGIQKVAFLGLDGDSAVKGLLNQTGVTDNTSLITEPISAMETDELKVFTAALIEKYRANTVRTAWPNRFTVPESDYNGLASQASPDFPIKSTLELLEEAFKLITRRPDFKILPLAYGDSAYNTLGKQRYALYNSDEESIKLPIPVDYTNTLANSTDNFSFQNVAYGQFGGVLVVRPLELMYFSY